VAYHGEQGTVCRDVPFFQVWIVEQQGGQFPLEKAVAPVEALDHGKGLFHGVQRAWRNPRNNLLVVVHALLIHLLVDGVDNLFLVAEMVIEISRADAHGSGDMIGGDRFGALLVEQGHSGFNNAFFGGHVRQNTPVALSNQDVPGAVA